VRELIAYFVDNLLPDLVFEEFGVLKQAKAEYAKPQEMYCPVACSLPIVYETRRLQSLNFSAWNFRSANWAALETMDESFP